MGKVTIWGMLIFLGSACQGFAQTRVQFAVLVPSYEHHLSMHIPNQSFISHEGQIWSLLQIGVEWKHKHLVTGNFGIGGFEMDFDRFSQHLESSLENFETKEVFHEPKEPWNIGLAYWRTLAKFGWASYTHTYMKVRLGLCSRLLNRQIQYTILSYKGIASQARQLSDHTVTTSSNNFFILGPNLRFDLTVDAIVISFAVGATYTQGPRLHFSETHYKNESTVDKYTPKYATMNGFHYSWQLRVLLNIDPDKFSKVLDTVF